MSTSLLAPPEPVPGFGRALETFRRAARQVPAYADFLARHGVDPAAVTTAEHFAALPPVTKENYLHHYPLPMLLWRGDASRAGTWSCSSGSTGRPTYWPRDAVSQRQAVELYGRILRESFQAHRRKTLLVVGFAMGNWIGGTYTYSAALALRRRGFPVSVIAPGIEADTILDNIAALGPQYEQVVLAGYPPFVKDVLDRADDRVLGQNLGLLLAGESISEQWRDYVLERLGRPGRTRSTCLIYGTADAGIMGHETRTTIAARRAARSDARLNAELFGVDDAGPTFVEYDCDYRFTEVDAQDRFLFTVDTAIPLVRYRINDVGRVLTPARLAEVLQRSGYRLPVVTSTASCGFLALNRRADIAATFYAVKIFPDNIRAALEDPAFAATVTGKFVLATETDNRFAQTLMLRVELQPGARCGDGMVRRLRERVVAALVRTNHEYARLHQSLGAAAEPTVSLHEFGSAGFGAGIKHQWMERAS
ncbi:phenylacetate--CoA ligase family protein [Nocardia africana]|uniref:Phenylacetate-CoA ligase n=1 Tax=Nocardia africana TaxID=134964 RepID=A0A378WWV0_9NOCA|nr:phenylacetate--CoA ligase family protein [Nocardia africana]MCC3313688.1 phenylacetate--CoA ligase family protein [Nocardia africana]SUA44931.1 phenylacetate-CoA ligase [Nocardia africana]